MSLTRFLRPVVVASEDELIGSVARKMRDARVGSVVITRNEKPIGILTDRDLTLRVIAEERSNLITKVSDVVTYGPFTLRESDEIETAVRSMREHGVRRLPVVDKAGRLVGVVSTDDLVIMFGEELAALANGIAESTDAVESR